MQPNQNRQRQRALQVDIQRVIEQESTEYGRMIAQLVRNNAILSTALDDQENENAELRAKLHAATGGGFNPGPSRTAAPDPSDVYIGASAGD